MCGIVGTIDWTGEHAPQVEILKRMLAAIRHRGPDEFGLYIDQTAGIGSARLSIIDLTTGQQPIANEDGSLWIVFNGEIFNYVELRADLERAGHRFSTHSDTEVILHLYEDIGPACLQRLNGQFAIAIWDVRQESLFLARDRLGIRPLFYAQTGQELIFGSEIKAILTEPRMNARLDLQALAQVFTFWAPLAPRTMFEGIQELPPGHYMLAQKSDCTIARYWGLDFPDAGYEEQISADEAAEQLRALLSDATRLRLRADVTVGSYLSGGLDSTFIATLIRQHTPDTLCTFSIAFEDAVFDERQYQEIATAFINTDHRRTECLSADIGKVFPEVIWHTEAPLLRTSPAPMYLLSKLVHENGIKVVLTGEGADEFLGGYDIYKEDKVRRFWARQPESSTRPMLLRQLYPYISDLGRGKGYMEAFFRQGMMDVDQPGYSHQIRWRNANRLQRFFSPELQSALSQYHPVEEFLSGLDGALSRTSTLAQAQFIEVTTFMSAYLLSSQGDRMMAANSVEGRFPFLDYRVVEFANRLPPHIKIRGLREKYVLKKSAQGFLPPAIWKRHKQPYRAPIHTSFFIEHLDYVNSLLSPDAIKSSGYFEPGAVERLKLKCSAGGRIGEGEDMALVGILSTQLVHELFVKDHGPKATQELSPLRICQGAQVGACR
jgi:asparagine synthase (glutamine-hydrolysing)